MAIDLASLTRVREFDPPRILVYGPEGIGKTTFGAGSPSPIFLPVEDGLGMMTHVPSYPLIKSYDELDKSIGELVTDVHPFRTCVLDSLDWLERLVWIEACTRNGWANIRAPGYGEGYSAALEVWREVLDGFELMRRERGMGFIFIAHAAIVNYKDPENPPYDIFQPKLHVSGKGVGANPLLAEAVDAIFFMNNDTSTAKDKTGGTAKAPETRTRAVGGKQRIVHTTRSAAYVAKNRWGMPDEIKLSNNPELTFSEVAQYIPYYQQQLAALAA